MEIRDECRELLDALETTFWGEPQPHSRMKHAVLHGYLPIFATKTASRAEGRRVVFADGYAGAGQYKSGDRGSPLVALAAKDLLAGYGEPSTLDCMFVERDPAIFEAMQCVVAGRGVCLHGDLREHLDAVLRRAHGVPLFMFLDPYGFLPPLDELIDKVLHRPYGGKWRVATELLVSLMTFAVVRQAGHRASTTRSSAQVTLLEALDAFMGGGWWRDVMDDPTLGEEDRERVLAERWAAEVERRSGYSAWPAPVPRRWGAKGYYYLVLVTEHPQGGWFFAGGLPRAMNEFYGHATVGHQLDIFDPDWELTAGRDAMKANLGRLLTERGMFKMMDVTRELYDGAFGKAGIKELTEVTRELSRKPNEQLEVVEGKITQKTLHDCVVRSTGVTSLF